MICVTAVDGEWLAELGPMFYSIKHSSGTRLENKLLDIKSQQILEKEMEKANEEMKKQRENIEHKKPIIEQIATPGRKNATQLTTPRRNRNNFGL